MTSETMHGVSPTLYEGVAIVQFSPPTSHTMWLGSTGGSDVNAVLCTLPTVWASEDMLQDFHTQIYQLSSSEGGRENNESDAELMGTSARPPLRVGSVRSPQWASAVA